MTALPAIKPLPLPERIRQPGVSPLPPECRGSGYSFAAAGRDCCHCAEYGDLRDAWLDRQDKRDGQGNLYRFHDLTDHIQGVSSPTCPTCRAAAGALPDVQASVPRAWLPGPELAKDTGGEGETR